MAEPELAPEEGLEPEAAPEEAVVEEPNEAPAEAQAETDRLEAIARRNGWRPKDEFRGDPEEWRDAEAYVEATFGIASAVKKKLAGVESTVENMARTQAAILEQQLAERERELLDRKREAVADADYEAVERIDQQRQQLRQNAPASQPLAPEAQSFIERNSGWYGKNQEATEYAVSRAGQYAQQGLVNPGRQLAAVERDMRQHFPELYPAPAKPPPRTAQPTRTATASNRTKGFHDMPAEAQAVARDMAARGVIPSTDIYVTNYFATERKVG